MNKRQYKKLRKKLYQDLIDYVTLELSLDKYWRKKLFETPLNKDLKISFSEPEFLPEYIAEDIFKNGLEFYITRVDECSEYFDSGLEIFKCRSCEFPDIIAYSGNNPNI